MVRSYLGGVSEGLAGLSGHGGRGRDAADHGRAARTAGVQRVLRGRRQAGRSIREEKSGRERQQDRI